jgi:glycosidase
LPDFFLQKLRQSVKEENPNAIIIGEVWEDAAEKIAYSQRRKYLLGDELDSVMNYPLKDGIISYAISGNSDFLLNVLHTLIDHYPKQTLDSLMNILGTHDTARILTVLSQKRCYSKDEMASDDAKLTENEREIAMKRLKIAVVLQYTLPGVPCIFYGDENGMEGFGDPFCRKCFDWNNLNEELLGFYQKLGAIRKYHAELFSNARFELIYKEEGFILFKRKNDNDEIYIFTNNSSKKYPIKLNGDFVELISETFLKNEFIIKENSYGIFYKINPKKSLNS